MENDIELISDLNKSWEELTRKYSISAPLSASIFEELVQKYTEKHRHYHNLTHIFELLKLAKQYENQLIEPDVIYFSIWFHDVVYQSTRKDNELKSAEFASEKMQMMQIFQDVISTVFSYILATKTHEITTENTDLAYFLDFDLAILATIPTVYENYCRAVREEYAFVPSFLYRKGRKKVLQSFLNRPKIYWQLTDLEEEARKNLHKELNSTHSLI